MERRRPFASFPNDRGQNRLIIAQHIARRKTHGQNASPRKPGVTRFIVLDACLEIVSLPIDLDGELCVQAKEIDNVRAAWMLAAKLQTGRAFAEFLPQHDFRQGHSPALHACEANSACLRLWRNGVRHNAP
jgi:hypothetical protein